MQKVNVFSSISKDDTKYQTKLCMRTTTLLEVLHKSGLSLTGATVYVDGKYIDTDDCSKSMAELGAGNPAFVTVRYGAEKPKKRQLGS